MTASHIVTASSIQKELNILWDSLENKNKMRASLFNLIFYSRSSPRDEYIRKITQKIIEKFPARIFFITSEDSSEKMAVKTAVSIMSAEQGEYDVTSDFIEVSTTRASELDVPFIILPHIIPDLPIFVVWAEDPSSQSPLREALEQIATRFIFDSETTQDLQLFAKSILSIKEHSRCEIADLNWARLESWRDLLTSVFNDDSLLAKLKKVHNLHIEYNAQQTPFFCHTKIQSIYLQAWLASRLEWKIKTSKAVGEALEITYETEGKEPIIVRITAKKQTTLPPGLILSVSIEDGEKDHFLFQRSAESQNQITCTYSSKMECALPTKFLIAKGESGQSLVREICHKGTSQHYLEIITLLSQMESCSLC
jgi:glucose-6-phosphate dehydrogenase assembly protein OpcA